MEKKNLSEKLEKYIELRYFDKRLPDYPRFSVSCGEDDSGSVSSAVQEYVDNIPEPETFSDQVNRYLREKDLSAVEVYRSLGMDRKHFSKIRSDKQYQPSKRTAILLAFAFQLTLDETEDLLDSAGFSLTYTSKSDIIVEYFIDHGIYDLMLLNEMLEERGLPLLMKCD